MINIGLLISLFKYFTDYMHLAVLILHIILVS